MAKRTCSVDGCERPYHAHGYCGMHNARFQRWGDPLKTIRAPYGMYPHCSADGCTKKHHSKGYCSEHADRFKRHGNPLTRVRAENGAPWEFVKFAASYVGDDCLIWPYAITPTGYGEVNVLRDGKRTIVLAHRAVLELATGGPPPDGNYEAAHTPVICHNRACVNPAHLRWATSSENNLDMFHDDTDRRGERSPFAKLTWAAVAEIRADPSDPDAYAERFGVLRQTIMNVITEATWKTRK